MGFFKPKSRGTPAPTYTGIQVQTAVSSLPVALYYGKARGAPNLIWYDDFKTIKKTTKSGGKGLSGPKQTTYTYSASIIMAMCQGPINGADRVWRDQKIESSYTALGFSLFVGENPQAAWGYLVSAHPDEALPYNGVAYFAAANYQLGDQPNLNNHNFEIRGLFYDTQGTDGDADPALVIEDFLTNPSHGAYYPVSSLDLDSLLSGPDATTTGDSAYQTYCRAMGFGISPALIEASPAKDTLAKWLQLTNSVAFPSGGKLKFVPWGDEEITANGVTYLPQLQIRYTLTEFLPSDDGSPVIIERTDPADAHNVIKLTIKNRAADYNEKPVEVKDQDAIEKYGEKFQSAIEAHAICREDMAITVAELIKNRGLFIRQKFKFKLDWRYCLLDPMDVIELFEEKLALSGVAAQIEQIEEDDDGNLTFLAWELPFGVASTVQYNTQTSQPGGQNQSTPPGDVNTPLIFQPPVLLTNGTPEVWIAISGGDDTTANPFWGGAQIWASIDDVNYQQIGEVQDPARQGELTATLATYGGVNPDASNTLAVSLVVSNGDLDSTSALGAAQAETLCYVDGELLSYEVATLTGPNAHNLTNLYRGLYGSTIGAHSAGSAFVRLDEGIFKYQLPQEYIGETIYLKFLSFNIWGYELQSLADVDAYTYTPDTSNTTTGVPGALNISSSVVTLADGTSVVSLAFDWGASAGPFLAGYELQISDDMGATWQDAGSYGPDAVSATVRSVAPATDYRGRIRALSSGPLMSPSAYVVSADTTTPTVTAPAAPFGFSFSQYIDGITASEEVMAFDPGITWVMPISLTNSQGNIGGAGATAPSAQTDFDIQVNGVSVGTMRFAASATTATFIKASATTVALGERTSIVAPANLNGMAGLLDFSIRGTR
jgi:hypothetical protein